MDAQFFSTHIAALNVEQSTVQSQESEARTGLFAADEKEQASAQQKLSDAQLRLAQIRGEIAIAENNLSALEQKEAIEKFKQEQEEVRKEFEAEQKAKEKQEEDLKFLDSSEEAKTDKAKSKSIYKPVETADKDKAVTAKSSKEDEAEEHEVKKTNATTK